MPDYGDLRNAGVTDTGPATAPVLRRPGRGPVLPRPARLRPAVRRRPLRGRRRHPRRASTSTPSRCRCPQGMLAKDGKADKNPIIGVWSTTDRRGVDGGYRQVSRLGMPLVNEVVIPLKDKDKFNASKPTRRRASSSTTSRSPELPKLIEAVYGIDGAGDPAQRPGVGVPHRRRGPQPGRRAWSPRASMLRLNMTTPVADEPEPPRCHRWRQPGLPERPSPRLTTSSTSRCRSSRASSSARRTTSVTASTPTTSRSATRSPTWRCRRRGSNADPHPSDSNGNAKPAANQAGFAERRRSGTPGVRWPRRHRGHRDAPRCRRHRSQAQGLSHPVRPRVLARVAGLHRPRKGSPPCSSTSSSSPSPSPWPCPGPSG